MQTLMFKLLLFQSFYVNIFVSMKYNEKFISFILMNSLHSGAYNWLKVQTTTR